MYVMKSLEAQNLLVGVLTSSTLKLQCSHCGETDTNLLALTNLHYVPNLIEGARTLLVHPSQVSSSASDL